MKVMLSYIRLLRPANGIMSIIAVWLGSLLAGSAIIPGRLVLFGMAAVFLISGAGMVVNDIFDIEIDKHNRPKRPLPSGKVSKKNAWVYAVVLFIVGNFFGALIGRAEFYVTIISSVLLIAYAWKLKKVVAVGHITVSFLVALGFFFGGLIAGDILAPIWLGLLAFLANMGREIYKTIDDMLGDKKAGIDNLALRFGVFRAKFIASAITLAAVVLSFVPFVLGQMSQIYLFFVVIADIFFLVAIGAPVKYSSKFSKIAMMIALLAFILGSAQVQALV